MNWEEAQEWEADWHGTCQNKVAGEYHQCTFIAPRLGLKRVQSVKGDFWFDVGGKRILDIGGGASSLLLKCRNLELGTVVDPLRFPDWVYHRYKEAGIGYLVIKAEELSEFGWDEAWIYNCLQHTEDPHKVILAARQAARVVRIYEYINIPVCDGHIHTLTEAQLNQWLGGEGKVEEDQRYFGIFPSNVNTDVYWDRIYRREGADTWRDNTEINAKTLAEIADEGSVLELGAGVGVLGRQIKGEYLGIDISPVAVQLMREQGLEADCAKVPPIPAGHWGTIIALELLEHLDPEDAMELVNQIATSCEKAIFSVPHDCMGPEEHAEHRTRFTMKGLSWLLSQGFSNLEISPVQNFGAEHLVAVCRP